jgi:NAD+ kinase
MSQARYQKVGLVVKHSQTSACELATQAGNMLRSQGLEVYTSEPQLAQFSVLSPMELAKTADILLVFGGDGTFISAARSLGNGRSLPLVGINMGSLGFLTEWKTDELVPIVQAIKSGNLTLETRDILEVAVHRGNQILAQEQVINDVVLSKRGIARLIDIKIHAQSSLISQYKCDGIIIATPMGSTAYNLAAGGAVIHPHTQAITVVPICPHALTTRPLVLPSNFEITLELQQNCSETVLTLDGQQGIETHAGDIVRVHLDARRKLQIFRPTQRSYFDVLKEKLKFGVRN